jgi:hypothetical protein
MGVTSATILPAIMQPLLPEKESRNGTVGSGLAQGEHKRRQAVAAFPSAALFANLPRLNRAAPAALPSL